MGANDGSGTTTSQHPALSAPSGKVLHADEHLELAG